MTRAAFDGSEDPEPVARDLLLFCRGFCVALTGHHEGEDRTLFPAIAAAHPELADTIRYLQQDRAICRVPRTVRPGRTYAARRSPPGTARGESQGEP